MKKLLLAGLLTGLAALGCGVVKKGGGTGKIVLTLTGSKDSLNSDEQGKAHSVEVRVFVLQSVDQFLKGSVEDLFELTQRKTFWTSFREDTLALEKITVNPGEKRMVQISYNRQQAVSGQVYLAVIGNFNRPPDASKDRRYAKLGAKGGKAQFYLPGNTIELPPKK